MWIREELQNRDDENAYYLSCIAFNAIVGPSDKNKGKSVQYARKERRAQILINQAKGWEKQSAFPDFQASNGNSQLTGGRKRAVRGNISGANVDDGEFVGAVVIPVVDDGRKISAAEDAIVLGK
ncbi:hypothetical protein HAX54_027232 [Datura stramonium]|uniref:Uncharacterized protein n=1 Tax=Datura stramonium TaxID=4076 RepID=A0ABS8S8K4_DATST|nr:hypothetical protein [Datura stramonium]